MFKVIIAGSRSFQNYPLLKEYADYKLSYIKDAIEIVSGGAKGADMLGERYAKEKGYLLNAAGYLRNVQMAEYADALIAFWDGKSRGTMHMIQIAHSYGLKVGVKHFD